MDTNMTHKEIEVGALPFTWEDALKKYKVGDEKKYLSRIPTMVTRIRGAVFRYQNKTGTQFSTPVDEDGYIHWTSKLYLQKELSGNFV